MDQGLWQTPESIDFTYSSHEWIQNNIVMWEILPQQCRLGLFQDSDFAGDLEDSKSTSGGTLCVLWKSYLWSNQLFLINAEKWYESRFLQPQPKKYQDVRNFTQTLSAWSFVMERRAQKCVERYCELANKETDQVYKVSTPCLDDHNFKRVGVGNGRRIIRCMFSKSLGMLVCGTLWQTRHFYGQ